jgi:hypothetical protein
MSVIQLFFARGLLFLCLFASRRSNLYRRPANGDWAAGMRQDCRRLNRWEIETRGIVRDGFRRNVGRCSSIQISLIKSKRISMSTASSAAIVTWFRGEHRVSGRFSLFNWRIKSINRGVSTTKWMALGSALRGKGYRIGGGSGCGSCCRICCCNLDANEGVEDGWTWKEGWGGSGGERVEWERCAMMWKILESAIERCRRLERRCLTASP